MSKLYQWRDTSSHSQSDKEKIPKEFTYQAKYFHITIHHTRWDRSGWYMSCHSIGLKEKQMVRSKNVPEAQIEALQFVNEYLTKCLKDLNGETPKDLLEEILDKKDIKDQQQQEKSL